LSASAPKAYGNSGGFQVDVLSGFGIFMLGMSVGALIMKSKIRAVAAAALGEVLRTEEPALPMTSQRQRSSTEGSAS
jgi:hypothetical protein